jgi:hypothetical protein
VQSSWPWQIRKKTVQKDFSNEMKILSSLKTFNQNSQGGSMISNDLYSDKWRYLNFAKCVLNYSYSWARVWYLLHTWPFRGRDNNAHIRSLRLEIDGANAHARACAKLYKNTSPMKWKYISSLKTHIYPHRFPNASAVTCHSYCKRETSLTKLKNSKSVMILVVRLVSSPTV